MQNNRRKKEQRRRERGVLREKEEEEKVGEGDTAREEKGRGPEEQLQVLEEPLLSPGEGPSVRSQSPTPRRTTRSPERVGGEQDIYYY